MKKRLVLVVVALMAVGAMAFAFVGCGGGSAEGDLSGTYGLSGFVAPDGTELTGDLLTTSLPASENYIEFGSGDKVTFVLMGQPIETTYTVSGDTVSVKDGTSSLEFIVDGDSLSYDSEMGKLIFSK
ncbi:MAG: hypothetical protein LBS98_04115 [Coriobacteriales bacterium]|nr:hypothetical protein [Coriobacteriales bacterium]